MTALVMVIAAVSAVPHKMQIGEHLNLEPPAPRRDHRPSRRKRRRRPRLLGPVTASWYYDSSTTACGFHAHYGIASRTLPCGTRVELEHDGHQVIATVDDRGPYVYSRLFDQDPATKAADDCGDLCQVDYRVLA